MNCIFTGFIYIRNINYMKIAVLIVFTFFWLCFCFLYFFFSDSCSLQISISIQHCTPMSALVGRGGVWVDELTSTTLSVCVSLVLYSNSKRSTCSLCKKASSQCCRFALSCSLKMLNFLFAGCLSALWAKRVGMASSFNKQTSCWFLKKLVLKRK